MPNDPRVKFKKKVYDASRNIMFLPQDYGSLRPGGGRGAGGGGASAGSGGNGGWPSGGGGGGAGGNITVGEFGGQGGHGLAIVITYF
jgi:hypothetical protein